MRPVRLSATALMAIAPLAFGIFTIPALNGGIPTSTAHAQSKIEQFNTQAKSKVEDFVDSNLVQPTRPRIKVGQCRHARVI
jgi:hypothetical protein